MASEVEICNRALQKLGAKRIVALTENSPNARSCNFAYEIIRDAELRKHPWSCAIKRASLAKLSDNPAFGKDYQYQLPTDFIRLLPPDELQNLNEHDWQIEGNRILSDYTSPLQIRYIYRLEDPNVMDSLLREAISCALAIELCIEIAQSNVKKSDLKDDYIRVIRDAKKVNAIERPALQPPEDPWVTVRE